MKHTICIWIFIFGLTATIQAQQFNEIILNQNLNSPREFTTGDLDNDGYIDIIIPEYTNTTIKVLYGSGDLTNFNLGSYSLTDPTVGGIMKPWATLVMDIDEDNLDDIVFSNYGMNTSATDGLYWIKNNGNRTFGNAQLIRFHDRCRGIYKANFDSDSRDEIAIAGDNNISNNIKILNISLTGGAVDLLSFYANRRTLHLTSTDFSNNGSQDLVYTSYGTGSETDLSNASTNGTKVLYGPNYNYGISLITNSPHSVAGTRKTVIDDFDEDGDIDFIGVSASGTKTSITSYATGSGQQSHYLNNSGSRNYTSIASGDFDNDNVSDIVVIDNVSNELILYPNSAIDGVPSTLISFGTALVLTSNLNSPTWIDSQDMDGDGDLDILVTNQGGGSSPGGFFTILENTTTLSNVEFEIDTMSIVLNDTEIIITNLPAQVKEVLLYDMSGRRIYSESISTIKNRISIQALDSGMYILKFPNLKKSYKFIVK